MLDSAAAITNINKENICPIKSSKKTEDVIILIFTANNTNSIDIIVSKTFFLFKPTPIKPIKNNIKEK